MKAYFPLQAKDTRPPNRDRLPELKRARKQKGRILEKAQAPPWSTLANERQPVLSLDSTSGMSPSPHHSFSVPAPTQGHQGDSLCIQPAHMGAAVPSIPNVKHLFPAEMVIPAE